MRDLRVYNLTQLKWPERQRQMDYPKRLPDIQTAGGYSLFQPQLDKQKPTATQTGDESGNTRYKLNCDSIFYCL